MIFTSQQRNALREAATPLQGPFEVNRDEKLVKAYPKLKDAIAVATRSLRTSTNVQIFDTGAVEVLFDGRDPKPERQLAKLKARA